MCFISVLESLDGPDRMEVTDVSMESTGPGVQNTSTTDPDHSDIGMDEAGYSEQCDFLDQFFHFVSLLKSLNLLHCVADHAIANVVQMKVRNLLLRMWYIRRFNTTECMQQYSL